MDQILEVLEVHLADIVTMGPFLQQSRGNGAGTQIDWVIVRRDSVWWWFEFT